MTKIGWKMIEMDWIYEENGWNYLNSDVKWPKLAGKRLNSAENDGNRQNSVEKLAKLAQSGLKMIEFG